MEVEKIYAKEVVTVSPDEKLSKALSLMESGRIHQIPVVSGRNFEGMLFLGDVVVEDKDVENTNVRSLMRKNIPSIGSRAPESEAIRLMLENGVRALPVIKDSKLLGIISEIDVLRCVREDFSADDIMSEPVTIGENEGVGKAKQVMREHNISRLPVLDSSGRISGIIDTLDMIKVSTPKGKKTRNFEKPGERISLSEFPVKGIMRKPVYLERNAQKKELIIALEKGGEVVITENGIPVGIVTPKDVLETFEKKESSNVIQISNLGRDDVLSKGIIYDEIDKWINKTGIPADYAYVYVHRHNIGGRVKYSLHMRMRNRVGMFVVKAVEWDLLSCVQDLVRKAQKLLEKKHGKQIEKRMTRGNKRSA